MRPVFVLFSASLALILAACQAEDEPAPAPVAVDEIAETPAPPETRRSDHTDTVHGTEVADPYRWLEQSADTPEVRDWIERQNAWSGEYFEAIGQRGELVERLESIWRFDRMMPPEYHTGWWFSSFQEADQNQPVLRVQRALEDKPRTLLDPNAEDPEGGISLHQFSVSPDGELMAWSTLEAGSDWQTVRVREIEGGDDRDDELRWIKYSDLAWTHDNAGFFYSRYPEPEGDALTAANRDHELWYHRLGTDQSEDVLIYRRPDEPDWRFVAEMGPDGRWLAIQVRRGTDRRHRVYVMDLGDPESPNLDAEMIKVVDELEAGFYFVGLLNDRLIYHTDHNAPRGRVVAIDPMQPDPESWQTLIAEREHPIADVRQTGNGFVVQYMENVRSTLRLFDSEGTETTEIPLPMPGSVNGLSANRDSDEIFFGFQSFLYPPTVFHYTSNPRLREQAQPTRRSGDDPSGLLRRAAPRNDGQIAPAVYFAPELDIDIDHYAIEQVRYSSRDATEVPMYIVAREDLELDGSHPTLLYGYGGFNISVLPTFSPETLVWLEQGGIYALANIRGGGEFGSEWHRAGQRENRQNAYDDFIAAAEYLIEQGYTRPERLGIYGRSNGGLLIGAVVNQRPELYRAAIPAVGVMDLLRFHQFTVGAGWIPDFGDPDDADDFRHLHAISPLHNVREEDYPAVLITTADHDDRVVPAHSFKYAAAMQHAQQADRPVLIRIETRAGHGAGTPTRVLIDQAADRLSFLLSELADEGFDS